MTNSETGEGMALPVPSLLDVQWEQHRQNMERAVVSRQEGDWHDFKAGLFAEGEEENLRKDVVALTNTSGGPYGGFGYSILGVRDDGTVSGLVGRDAALSEDARQLQIKNRVQAGIDPYIDVQVKEFLLEGKRVHLLVVPQTPLHWHLVRLPLDQHGHWIRRGRSSERPLLDDYAKYHARLLEQVTAPLRTEQEGLLGQLIALRQNVADLKSRVSPEDLSPVEFVRTAFTTPERTLLRQIRRLIAEYLGRGEGHFRVFNDLDVDRLVEHPGLRTPEKVAALRSYFEMVETDVRPLVEIVAHVMHEAPPTDLVRAAVQEVTQVLAESSTYQLRLLPYQAAVRSYPAQLYLHSVALSAYYAPDWRVFHDVLLHVQESVRLDVGVNRMALAFYFAQRPALDEVARLFEPVPTSPHPASNRLSRLLPQPAWVGDTLPALRREGRYTDGEALLTFGFLVAVATYSAHSPLSVGADWWRYLNADRILARMLERWAQQGKSLFGRREVQLAGRLFDDMDKQGHHLTVRASEVLPSLYPEWASSDWWNEGMKGAGQ